MITFLLLSMLESTMPASTESLYSWLCNHRAQTIHKLSHTMSVVYKFSLSRSTSFMVERVSISYLSCLVMTLFSSPSYTTMPRNRAVRSQRTALFGVHSVLASAILSDLLYRLTFPTFVANAMFSYRSCNHCLVQRMGEFLFRLHHIPLLRRFP